MSEPKKRGRPKKGTPKTDYTNKRFEQMSEPWKAFYQLMTEKLKR